MSANHEPLTVWTAPEVMPAANASTPEDIAEYARPQLSARDVKSIISALNGESYEMMATFVWAKASAVLKKQLATLGMEFVGEMLSRPDIDEDSDPSTAIADHEAITLAEDLGLISTTQGLRLKHAMELVSHFTNLDQSASTDEMMMREEAIGLLRNCVTSILSRPSFEGAIRFVDFRKALGERTLKPEDTEVQGLAHAQYFFVRTTLSVLLSLVKTGTGVIKEHALGNFSVLLPIMWANLREPERWQVGQAYAEVNAKGDRTASAGLKHALLKVQGFDFVPETLRSSTFTEAAARVLTAHFGFNNFFNEAEPMETLANLGTAIPKPAFAKCMEATLAVWLGNQWGNSWSSEAPATKVLDSLRNEQWEYYLSECLRRDRTVLDRLSYQGKPLERWFALASAYRFGHLKVRLAPVKQLCDASTKMQNELASAIANKIRMDATT